MASAPAPMHAGAATRALGRTDYEATWHAMQGFTAARNPATPPPITSTSVNCCGSRDALNGIK